jgi:hypothetical protein
MNVQKLLVRVVVHEPERVHIHLLCRAMRSPLSYMHPALTITTINDSYRSEM